MTVKPAAGDPAGSIRSSITMPKVFRNRSGDASEGWLSGFFTSLGGCFALASAKSVSPSITRARALLTAGSNVIVHLP
jgi:hypothetical protein